ncbi:membrane protein CvpA [Wolbachia endosymbiont of Armadillidium vulgare str. wVulC]|uniref:CvpA family protein n=1 Tax=Wolbachia endosymbiont of Armadillidium vulgare TaxID=77039 RepID=UPI000649618F|nr:CvpA family protein [Wolbachia endosymbiont of Armadillidium vulgare]KLT23170.1 membrane protein CvpA [Wolbachia endosymbiont of Armadillidium vulgare str. wVulC]OJH30760.1 Colicin V production protein [Wolbachia endosymbiont of Armadillidium vulgare]OJH31905.1 Colicin V production protein [Wolbachia endosymbiont of Armadillidium vulgare]
MFFDSLIIFIIVLCVIISVTRGFIKELCALMFLLLSVFLTASYYDFFIINYSNYFDSKVTQNILSTISVFIVLNLTFMTMNNWLMYILLPIRLGLMDRVTGIFVGALRGILLSYVLFFAVHLYCHTVYDKKEGESKIEAKDILPNWIINSHSYQALFVTTEEVIDMYVPESLILKIKEIGEEMVDQEKSKNNKEK